MKGCTIEAIYSWKGFHPWIIAWLGGVMMLGKLPVPGILLLWVMVGQGPTALAVGVGRGCLDFFFFIYHFHLLSPFLWETAQYRLKYCLKGQLNTQNNQPTAGSVGQRLTNWAQLFKASLA